MSVFCDVASDSIRVYTWAAKFQNCTDVRIWPNKANTCMRFSWLLHIETFKNRWPMTNFHWEKTEKDSKSVEKYHQNWCSSLSIINSYFSTQTYRKYRNSIIIRLVSRLCIVLQMSYSFQFWTFQWLVSGDFTCIRFYNVSLCVCKNTILYVTHEMSETWQACYTVCIKL